MPFFLSPRCRQGLLAGAFSLLGALSSASLLAAPVDDLIAEANARAEADDLQGAYDVLAAESMTYAGDADFDYWLGMLAAFQGDLPA